MAIDKTPTAESHTETIWKVIGTVIMIGIVLYFFHGCRVRYNIKAEQKEQEKQTRPVQVASNAYTEDITIKKHYWSLPVKLRNGEKIEFDVIQSDIPLCVEINRTTEVHLLPTAHLQYRPIDVQDVLKELRFRICTHREHIQTRRRAGTVQIMIQKPRV